MNIERKVLSTFSNEDLLYILDSQYSYTKDQRSETTIQLIREEFRRRLKKQKCL